MNKNINRTLKMKLLISPKPTCNKKEFFQLHYRMFGDEKDIIDFLEATETLKKITVAKKIVYRLAFQSNFSPSLGLLDYLAEFESTIRYNRSSSYQSRDHYIHICYLYLLGIYLFFYVPELNEKLHNSLSLIRYSEYLNEEDNFVKSFLGAWKYFVLFHDIAYPLEYLGNKDGKYNKLEKKSKKKAENLYKLTSISKGIYDILSLKILARIIAVGNAVDDFSLKTNNLFFYLEKSKEQFITLDGKGRLDDYIKEKRGDEISYLQNIKSGDDVKVFLSVFKCEDFFVVLKEEAAIKCIVDCNNCFVLDSYMDNDVIKTIVEDRKLLFQDEFFQQCLGFQIEYYGINLKSKYTEFAQTVGLQPEILLQLNFNLKNTINMQEVSFLAFCECYKRYNKKGYKIIGKDIKSCVNEFVVNEIKKINVEIGKLSEKQYNEYAAKYLLKYRKEIKKNIKTWNIENIKNQMVNSATMEGQQISNISLEYNNIRRKLENEINAFCEFADDSIWKLYDVRGIDQILAKLQSNTKTYIQRSLQKAVGSKRSICDILKKYHMGYSRYDHGITAAMVFILHFALYQSIVKDSENSEILCVGFNIPNTFNQGDKEDIIKEKYVGDYKKSSGQIIYAILVHNLYPANFSDEKMKMMKTNLSSNPFAFFCMLCDALQNWGRPFNINPMKEDYPPFIDAEKYNIKADKYITVKIEEKDPLLIHKYLEPFSNTLNQYLEGASKWLRVIFK